LSFKKININTDLGIQSLIDLLHVMIIKTDTACNA